MAEIPTNHIFDIIIIGAGIMGSCAAYEISKLNKKVLLLEQFDLLHHLGSSHGESRTIRATYPEPYYPPMVLESSLLWESAQSAAGYRVITPTPQLDLGPSTCPSLQSTIRNCSPDSLPATILDSETTLTLVSGAFRLPDGWIALSTPLGGIIKPTKAVAMFQSLAVRHGAVIRDLAVVDGIAPISGVGIQISTTDGRTFHAVKCVVTAGAWTSKLVKMITGRDLPIQPLHTFIWYWKIKEGFESEMTPAAGFPTFASYGLPYVYGTPAMEFPGLIKIAFHGGWHCDPNSRDWSLDADEMVGRVAEWIERVMPGRVETAIGPVMKQTCMYSMTPDEDFVIDFLGGGFGKEVVVAGGFSGHGFKMGPLVGKMVAEMVVDGEARTAERIGVDMRVFGLGRFEGGRKGNVKEFGDQVKFHSGSY